MEKITPSLTVFLISVLTSACLHRADSLRMLEVRADYEGKETSEASELKLENSLSDISGGVPVRTAPKTAHIWIFPHETPGKEYFWGGWISVVVEGDQWEIERRKQRAPEKPGKTNPKAPTKGKRKGAA